MDARGTSISGHYLRRSGLSGAFVALSMGCQTQGVVQPSPPPEISQASISDMKPVVGIAEYLAKIHGGKDKVLVLYDIDNTLLASTTPLGSDQWFDWQLNAKKDDSQRICPDKDTDCVINAQEFLYLTRPMRLTDDSVSATVRSLNSLGFTQWVITARGSDVSSVTFREIRRYSLKFSPFTLDSDAPPEVFTPTSVIDSNPELKPLSGNLTAPTAIVRLESGVYFTSGNHKGTMMRILLAHLKAQSRFTAVLFVDDKERHVEGMREVMGKAGFDVKAYHYTAEQALVERFEKDQETKSKVTRQWCDLARNLEYVEQNFATEVVSLVRTGSDGNALPLSKVVVNVCGGA